MREGTVGRDGATLEGVSPLGDNALLVAWRDRGPPDRRWRLLVNGAGAPAPRTGLALGDAGGGLRLLMAGLPGDGRRPATLRLEASGGTASVPVDVAEGAQLPLGRLARGLDAPGRARLASWLLGTCPALLPAGGEADLALLCRDLLDALPPARRPAVRRCRLSDGWTVVEATPATVGPHPEAFVLGSRRTVRGLVAPAAPDAGRSGPHPLSLAFEDDTPGEPRILVLVGRDGVACRRLAPARGPLASARAWLGAGESTARARAATLDLAALLDGRGLDAGPLVEELRLLVPPAASASSAREAAGPVVGTLEFLSVSDGRLTAVGTVRDPHGLIAALRLEQLGSRLEVPRADWVTAAAGPDATFVAAAAIPSGHPHAPWKVSLVLRSGAMLDLGEGPTLAPPGERLAILLAAAAPLAGIPGAAALLGPAAREASAEHAAGCRVGTVREFGPARRRPRACLVLPSDGKDGAATRIVAMLASEPAKIAVEVVLLASDPEAVSRVGHEAETLAGKYDLAVRLVLPTASVRPLDLVRLGAETAGAPILLTFGAGIVPRVRGWAGTLLEALDRSPDLALAGLPVSDVPVLVAGGRAAGSNRIPSLDAAALRLAALARVGGLAPDWLDPGCRDLDLTTRLLNCGYRASMLTGPACVRRPAQAGHDGPAGLAVVLDATRPDAPQPAGARARRSRPAPPAASLRVAA